ncbi:phosphodiesterase [Huintestinicola sp.]|uniref:phosphodiesterase n=1 Tax=Huintestinicola sp. TaxID=2981661 RepID=UPI003D7DDCA4
MKLMFASDIHGSAPCLEKLFERYEAEAPKKLILLGDLLYHGPRNDLPEGYAPKTVIRMLNEHKKALLCVRGNCEAEVDQMVLEFPVMADYMTMWLGDRMVFCTHGHLFDPDNMPLLNYGDVVISGHTHLYRAEEKDGIYIVNTGSVSLPKGGNPRSYVIYEDNKFTVKDMDGTPLSVLTLR